MDDASALENAQAGPCMEGGSTQSRRRVDLQAGMDAWESSLCDFSGQRVECFFGGFRAQAVKDGIPIDSPAPFDIKLATRGHAEFTKHCQAGAEFEMPLTPMRAHDIGRQAKFLQCDMFDTRGPLFWEILLSTPEIRAWIQSQIERRLIDGQAAPAPSASHGPKGL